MALNLKLNLIKNPSQSVRYLGIKVDQNLNWKDHISDIAVKLNRANALLFEKRNFVNITILKTIYLAIFDSHNNCTKLDLGSELKCYEWNSYTTKKGHENCLFQVKELPWKPFIFET